MGSLAACALAHATDVLVPAPTTKKSVDVEKLVAWAFRDELTKRHCSSAEGIWDRIAGSWIGGTETSGHAPQRYDFGLPHPDAEALERAIDALPRFAFDWNAAGKQMMGDLWLLLRARDVILDDEFDASFLVRHHAIMGTRPAWDLGAPMPSMRLPERGPQDRPMVVGECRGHNLYSSGSYCPLAWSPSPIAIALARADYAAWHWGLTRLAATLDLDGHAALAPSAPARPWEARSNVRRLFEIPAKKPLKPLPLRQQGPRAGPRLKRGINHNKRNRLDG